MTENEAIKEIHRLCCNESQYYPKGERKCKDNCMYGDDFCAFQIAIKAMEEVQEYRKIGTVEECREAVGKTKARKCIKESRSDRTYYKCPSCGKIQMTVFTHGIPTVGKITGKCKKCGQRLEE